MDLEKLDTKTSSGPKPKGTVLPWCLFFVFVAASIPAIGWSIDSLLQTPTGERLFDWIGESPWEVNWFKDISLAGLMILSCLSGLFPVFLAYILLLAAIEHRESSWRTSVPKAVRESSRLFGLLCMPACIGPLVIVASARIGGVAGSLLFYTFLILFLSLCFFFLYRTARQPPNSATSIEKRDN